MMKPKEQNLKLAIKSIAVDLGFDDVRLTPNPMAGDKPTAVFLVKRYTPANGQAVRGRIAISEYYPCSQFGYENALGFIDRLASELGIRAEVTDALDYKKTIVKTGGTIGRNSLYYHPKFGSFINLRCVLIDAKISPDEEAPMENLCEKCMVCINACPMQAIDQNGFTREKCLRHMMSKGIPEHARHRIYQLLGCERCQLGCPMNPDETKEVTSFDLLSVIKGQQTKPLKQLCGKNMATRTRLLTQSMAFAVAKGYKEALNEIEALTDDESDRVREMAVWARKELRR